MHLLLKQFLGGLFAVLGLIMIHFTYLYSFQEIEVTNNRSFHVSNPFSQNNEAIFQALITLLK